MNIENQNKVMIFKFESQYGANYSVGLTKKDKDGKYVNGYMPVKFKKVVELNNQTEIFIKKAWLTFNTKDKKTYPYIFINEFETVENKIEKGNEIIEQKQNDPYEEFANETKITDNDLPF